MQQQQSAEMLAKIQRQAQIEMAKVSLDLSLPQIHQQGRERRERRRKTTNRLQTKLENRDYVRLLYAAAMSSLYEQKGRTDKTYVTLKESGDHKGMARPGKAHWMVPPWRNIEARSREGE